MDYDLSALKDCVRCPRLVAHHTRVRESYPHYHAAPVGGWGGTRARLLIVGLAPGLHGATRTGRAFVGDASGEFLFAALHRRGFATHPEPARARLRNARITNVVKCLPPGNAPVSSEINTCMGYLRTELRGFCPLDARRPRVVLSLGGVAHRAVCRALEINRAPFVHGGEWLVRPHFWLLSSFHPSRLNVNTRRLTADMLDTVLERAAACLD